MKKTILIASYSYFPNIGGIENSLKYLAQSYTDMGYSVIVVVSDASYDKYKLPHKELIDDIAVYRYPTYSHTQGIGKYFRGVRSIYSAWKLLKSLKNSHNVILTLSRFHTSTLLAKIANLSNVIYLVPGVVKNQNNSKNFTQSNGLSKLKQNLSRIIHHTIQKHALKRSDQVLVFSQNMAKQISEIVPCLDKLPVVKPGVDTRKFFPIADKEPLRQQFNIPIDKIILLTVGRFVRAKGFELVVDAMDKLPNCHLVMVGDGQNYSLIKQKINASRLNSQVTLVGSQSDVVPYYQLADIFMMSSTYEPLGQTILEGLASGLPIVAFKGNSITTATQEILNEEEAIYTEHVCSSGVVNAIKKLTSDNNLMSSLSINSRNIAIDRFSWNTLATQILDYRKDATNYSPKN